jgi:Leucine-rich repeat (LRR) protein
VGIREYTSFPDALKAPEKVRRIYVLVGSSRTRLPDFRLFPNLEELTLHGPMAHVTRFPQIFACTKLRSLTFTGSGVARIPPGFTNLQRLEEVAIVGNPKLTALPDDITALGKLRRLAIDSNALAKLPATIGKLGRLVELVAYNNRLRELPPSLYKLAKLRWLELQCNRLATPPVALMKLKLRHLQTDFAELDR